MDLPGGAWNCTPDAVQRLSQDCPFGRASVLASPNISWDFKESGLVRTLALTLSGFEAVSRTRPYQVGCGSAERQPSKPRAARGPQARGWIAAREWLVAPSIRAMM